MQINMRTYIILFFAFGAIFFHVMNVSREHPFKYISRSPRIEDDNTLTKKKNNFFIKSKAVMLQKRGFGQRKGPAPIKMNEVKDPVTVTVGTKNVPFAATNKQFVPSKSPKLPSSMILEHKMDDNTENVPTFSSMTYMNRTEEPSLTLSIDLGQKNNSTSNILEKTEVTFSPVISQGVASDFNKGIISLNSKFIKTRESTTLTPPTGLSRGFAMRNKKPITTIRPKTIEPSGSRHPRQAPKIKKAPIGRKNNPKFSARIMSEIQTDAAMNSPVMENLITKKKMKLRKRVRAKDFDAVTNRENKDGNGNLANRVVEPIITENTQLRLSPVASPSLARGFNIKKTSPIRLNRGFTKEETSVKFGQPASAPVTLYQPVYPIQTEKVSSPPTMNKKKKYKVARTGPNRRAGFINYNKNNENRAKNVITMSRGFWPRTSGDTASAGSRPRAKKRLRTVPPNWDRKFDLTNLRPVDPFEKTTFKEIARARKKKGITGGRPTNFVGVPSKGSYQTRKPTPNRPSSKPSNSLEPTFKSSTKLTSKNPSANPSVLLSVNPTKTPSFNPSKAPSIHPTKSRLPSFASNTTSVPSKTILPTVRPSLSFNPSISLLPSVDPSLSPSSLELPISSQPSSHPSVSLKPSISLLPSKSLLPSRKPSDSVLSTISSRPSRNPSVSLEPSISQNPSISILSSSSSRPSSNPSGSTSPTISSHPSRNPSVSLEPSISQNPSISSHPSLEPSVSMYPTVRPSLSFNPSISLSPSKLPSSNLSNRPSISKTPSISSAPSNKPSISVEPSNSSVPSNKPSVLNITSNSNEPTPNVTTSDTNDVTISGTND